MGKPTCGRCIKSNKSCVWDVKEQESLLFRSENEYARGRRRRPRNKAHSLQPSAVTLLPSHAANMAALCFPLESHALNFWVANYGFGIDGLDDLDYDHSHLILPYWHRVPADSSLRLALLAVAHAAFGRARSSDAAIKKATNLYHRTLNRVKDEIEFVTATNIEQLLLAVKLLESFEVRVERF